MYWGTQGLEYMVCWGTQYIGVHGVWGYMVYWGTRGVWFLGVPGEQAQGIIGVQSYRGAQGPGPRGCFLRNTQIWVQKKRISAHHEPLAGE